MDLWIRSQDKLGLTKVNNNIGLKYNDHRTIIANYIPDFNDKYDGSYDVLGTYETEKRALEVLDEISDTITKNKAFVLYSNIGDFTEMNKKKEVFQPVYIMPKE